MTKVFVYGSLKQGFWNNRYLLRAKYLGKAVSVRDSFTLVNGGFPYLLNEGISRVKGELYEIRDDDDVTLPNLDRLEGVPYHYERVEGEFILEGDDEPSLPGLENIETAFMYVASRKSSERAKQYAEFITPNDENISEWRGE